jgi:hypothetical protein
MTHFLVSEERPEGYRLEDILSALRKDILIRCTKIQDDPRTEAKHVLSNNIEILQLITKSIQLAEDSTHVLDKAFGPSQAAKGGPPRIGD